jgi:hypothetical protein
MCLHPSAAFNRRVLKLDLSRRQQDDGRRFKLLGRQPQWKKDAFKGYDEDDSVLTVKWPSYQSTLLLKLRSTEQPRYANIKRHLRCLFCSRSKNSKSEGERDMTGNAVFVRMDEVDSNPQFLVLLDREPTNFLWKYVHRACAHAPLSLPLTSTCAHLSAVSCCPTGSWCQRRT